MYDTEMMRKILTSQMAREILNQLAPIYGEARVALWLFQSIGWQLDDMKEWAQEVMDQVTPHRATWSLDYWEDELGISRDPTLSTEKRRERVLSYMRYRAPMNPYTLARIASSAADNAECRIEERTGKPANFTVWVTGFPNTKDRQKIMSAIDRAKQARLSYDIKYQQNTTGAVYVGGTLQLGYDITIRQV